MENDYLRKAETYLNILCSVKPNRRTGSPGNRKATEFFKNIVKQLGYIVDTSEFNCLDFISEGASLVYDGNYFMVNISPYSLGCDIEAELEVIFTFEELKKSYCRGKLLLMKGEICKEQLMPKNFVFYNPDSHKKIYTILEEKQPVAIITATKKNFDLVGAIYPFPLIEDGDFNISSVYCTDIIGDEIAKHEGKEFKLKMHSERISTTACNVIALKNPEALNKIVVCAHIDAYGNSPGAADNASGIVILLLLAEMLQNYNDNLGIEIIALNGEDNYSAGGQMDYLKRYGDSLEKIICAINVDAAGYINGKTVYSLYNVKDKMKKKANNVFRKYNGIIEGEQWFQGDHMIFVQKNIPAIAFTSEKMKEFMTFAAHTSKDTLDMVECYKIVETAYALKDYIIKLQ